MKWTFSSARKLLIHHPEFLSRALYFADITAAFLLRTAGYVDGTMEGKIDAGLECTHEHEQVLSTIGRFRVVSTTPIPCLSDNPPSRMLSFVITR